MGAGGASTGQDGFKLVGFSNFKRHNPRTDHFPIHCFHHVEFWCSDATNVYKRFQHGLGMRLVAKTDQSTGNSTFCSYVLKSNELVFSFTAPYGKSVASNSTPGSVPLPHFSHDVAFDFIINHGLAVRAVGLEVTDAADAYYKAVAHGGKGVQSPVTIGAGDKAQVISEVLFYGDVVLRFISGCMNQPYLAGYVAVEDNTSPLFGLQRLDHAVGNVPVLADAANYIMKFTGFHEFAEFVAEDVGTVDSGLNSVVLANNNEYVLLPVNEPTFGTPRKSQIQTYLEQNQGPGLQHMALKTDDIFKTLREMQARSDCGGFEFMPRPSDKYYRSLPAKVGDSLTAEQLAECENLGILVDKDDQGVLLQIFTKPLGDRPTVFFEIIQRVGCMKNGAPTAATTTEPAAVATEVPAPAAPAAASIALPEVAGPKDEQAAGCGGFGKGNFSELFKRIEDYERTLNV